MVKTKPWEEIRALAMPETAEAHEAYERERREMLGEVVAYNLAELRKLRSFTQVELARALDIAQPSLSALERRSDVQLQP